MFQIKNSKKKKRSLEPTKTIYRLAYLQFRNSHIGIFEIIPVDDLSLKATDYNNKTMMMFLQNLSEVMFNE